MLATILLSILVVGILFAGMAVGVILANKPVKGSCGGLGTLGLSSECDICGGSRAKCDEENNRPNADPEKTRRLSSNALKA